jgi:hypothetical protein
MALNCLASDDQDYRLPDRWIMTTGMANRRQVVSERKKVYSGNKWEPDR